MQIVYLLSGINCDNKFNEDLEKCLKKDLKNKFNITIIASSFDNNEKTDIYYTKTISMFEKSNINFKQKYLIDNRVTKEKAIEYINNSKVIFLMGGDPYLQMKSINEYGLKSVIENKNGIIIGVSAGSINMAKKVCYMDEDKQQKLLQYNGIGLTDINIYPHLNFLDIDYLKEVFEVSKSKKIIALPNDSFIRIKEGKEDYFGDYYEIDNGTIEIPKKEYIHINHLGTIKLETKRLLLRRTKCSDIEEFFYIQLNPNLRKYLGSTKLGSNLEKEKNYFNEDNYNNLNYYRWTIERKEDK